LSTVSKMEVVAVAAVKKFQEMIDEYKGPPAGLRTHLTRQLRRMESKGDSILADIIDEIL